MSAPLTIHDLLLELMVARLQAKLSDEVVNPDLFKLNVVKIGRLQDDPTTGQSNILLHPGDDKWRDVLDVTGAGISGPEIGPYVIGANTAFWRRRFYLDMQFYLTTNDRDEARKTAFSLRQRVHVALMTIPFNTFPVDVYGERAHMLQIFDGWLEYGGGEGTYIWRGQTRLEWITEIEPDENALA